MKTLIAVLLAVPVLAFAGPSENQLIAVPAMTKGASVVSLDFVSNGEAAGFQFHIDVGVSSDKNVDLSACTAAIPKNRSGSCGFKDGTVIGVVYSPDGTAIPAGVINVGKISVSGAKSAPSVVSVHAFDVAGNDLTATVASFDK